MERDHRAFEWRKGEAVGPQKRLSHGISPKNFHRRRSRPGQAEVERIRLEVQDTLTKEGRRKIGQYQEIQRSAFKQVTTIRSWPLQARAFAHFDDLMEEYHGFRTDDDENDYQLQKFENTDESESIISSSSAVSVELEPKRILRDMMTSPAKSRLKVQYKEAFSAERLLRKPVSLNHEWSSPLWSLEPRVFATEISSTGKRKYVVGNLGRFMDLYWRKVDILQRHHYELIRENTPCRLYLDLEFSKKTNLDLTDDGAELLLDELWAELAKDFSTQFRLDLQRKHIVDLDSSTESKFSRHWIVHLPGHYLFAHTVAVGKFVRKFISRLADEQATGSLKEKSPILSEYLLVNAPPGKRAEKDPFQKVCIVDLGVYTRNRLFRLLGSSKFGKHSSAALRIADANQFPFPEGFSNELFYLPAIRRDHSADHQETHPSSTESWDQHENDVEDNLRQFISKTDWSIHAEALSVSLVVPANASKIAYPLLPYEDAPETHTDSKNLRAPLAPLSSSVSTGPSPYPTLDAFVMSELGTRGEIQGRIRAWSVQQDPDSGMTNQITYQMSRNRFCEFVGRAHKSNNICWTIGFSDWQAVQGCHDPECRLANFRGTPVDLPETVIESINDALFEEQLTLLDDQALLRPTDTIMEADVGPRNSSAKELDFEVDESFEKALLALDLGDDADRKQDQPISEDSAVFSGPKPVECKKTASTYESDSSSSSGRSALLALVRGKERKGSA